MVVLATALPCLDFSREVTIYEAYGDLTKANLAQGWDDLLVESERLYEPRVSLVRLLGCGQPTAARRIGEESSGLAPACRRRS